MPGLEDALGSAVCRSLNRLSRNRQAQMSGILHVPELSAPVEVQRDRWGVPHIYAANTRDVMFAQGYVHAQDRLWQMDFQRRLVAGRLAEVLGSPALPTDRWLRIVGMRRVSAYEASQLRGNVRTEFQAFADGVNAFINRGRLPLEFTLLHYRPEPWTPTDSLSWTKMLGWSLSVNWESELLRAHLIARLGPELAADLDPEDDGASSPCIMPRGVDYASLGKTAEAWASAARPLAGPPAQDGIGSNAWVISGSRTASGRPILANDLHQLMAAPAIWYENHLQGGELHIAGASFPGVPGIIVGHNEHVAWGISNGFADVQDLYVEHLRHGPNARIQYEFRGEWYDARVIRETIRVRGRAPVIQDTIITCHGPIINRLAPDLAGEQPLALRWTCHEPETMALAYHRVCRARNCLELHEALRDYTIANQNIVYADTEGNIGYTYPGRLPIRAQGDGRVPVPGWTGEYEWTGYVPFDELPHLYNPPEGYVAAANNRVADGTYPYHISCDYCCGDRARRIREMIEAGDGIDTGYVRRMQLDQISPGAHNLAAHVGTLQSDDPELEAVTALLREWDGTMRVDSGAAAVLQLLVPRLVRLMLEPRLGNLVERYLGRGPNPVLADGSLLGFRAWEWLQSTIADPHSPWFDLGDGETRDAILLRALRDAVRTLKARLGPDPAGWAWGKLHTLTFNHTLSRVRPLQQFYNRGPYPIGGDYTTVCATGNAQHPEFHGEAVIGPNYGFIADMASLGQSTSLLAPGQSARAGNPHYDDQIEDWLAGRSHPMLFDRQDVVKEATAKLFLLPG